MRERTIVTDEKRETGFFGAAGGFGREFVTRQTQEEAQGYYVFALPDSELKQ
jgi:hypothetical protein